MAGQGLEKARGRKPTAALIPQTTWKTVGQVTQEQYFGRTDSCHLVI